MRTQDIACSRLPGGPPGGLRGGGMRDHFPQEEGEPSPALGGERLVQTPDHPDPVSQAPVGGGDLMQRPGCVQ